jgi:hypothetical protein
VAQQGFMDALRPGSPRRSTYAAVSLFWWMGRTTRSATPTDTRRLLASVHFVRPAEAAIFAAAIELPPRSAPELANSAAMSVWLTAGYGCASPGQPASPSLGVE